MGRPWEAVAMAFTVTPHRLIGMGSGAAPDAAEH